MPAQPRQIATTAPGLERTAPDLGAARSRAVDSHDGFGYDRLARVYPVLERLAFGDALQRARLAHLDALASCRQVLTLAEGDGRFVAELARRQPYTQVVATDASAGMIRVARARLAGGANVRFLQTDLRTLAPPPSSFDAIVGLFAFDLFERDTLRTMLPALARSLRPGGLWLHADFAVPDTGWRRWRSRAWLRFLYLAFGLATDMEARRLEPVAPLLERSGLERVRHTTSLHGLVEASLYRRPAEPLETTGPPPCTLRAVRAAEPVKGSVNDEIDRARETIGSRSAPSPDAPA